MNRLMDRDKFDRRKDLFWIGLIAGTLVPVAAYGILLLIYDGLEEWAVISDIGFAEDFRTRTLILFAICANIFVLNYFRKRYMDNSMRGVVFPTLLFMLGWFYFFGRQIIGLG